MKLAAPQGVSGLRIRLDFHCISPFRWILVAIAHCLPRVELRKSKLGTPQGVAGLRVRLDFHRSAPFFEFSPLGHCLLWLDCLRTSD